MERSRNGTPWCALVVCVLLAAATAATGIPSSSTERSTRDVGLPAVATVYKLRFRYLQVSLFQKGMPLPAKNGVVMLRKQRFDLVFEMSKPCNVWVNASFDGELYRRARKGLKLDKIFAPGHLGADYTFNPHKQMFLSPGVPASISHYWKIVHNSYYVYSPRDHRCDKAVIMHNGCSCRRTIASLWQGKKRTPLRRVRKSMLYLVFYKPRCNKSETRCVETKREALALKFR